MKWPERHVRALASVPHGVFRRGQRVPEVSTGIGVEGLGMAIECDRRTLVSARILLGSRTKSKSKLARRFSRPGAPLTSATAVTEYYGSNVSLSSLVSRIAARVLMSKRSQIYILIASGLVFAQSVASLV